MNIRSSTRPHEYDRRDYSYHRSKPQFAAVAAAVLEPLEYNYDRGLTMYNQTIAVPPYYMRPLFYGCTGMSGTDICTDQDGKLYDPQYTYERTCDMEGHGYEEGCSIRTSLKSLQVFPPRYVLNGMQIIDDLKTRRGPYLNVDRAPGRDWFDSFRIALRANAGKRTSISMGVPWFKSWETTTPTDGRLQRPTDTELETVRANINAFSWHCVKISGEKVIDGEPYLCIKSWQGPNIGDRGWLYLKRDAFNKMYDVWGTFGGCPGDVDPKDVQRIRGELYQQLWVFIARLARLFGLQVNVYA